MPTDKEIATELQATLRHSTSAKDDVWVNSGLVRRAIVALTAAEQVRASEPWRTSSIQEARDMIEKYNLYLQVHVLGDPRKCVTSAND